MPLSYAASHLQCRHIIVLGHADCGAVTAALKGEGKGYIKEITADILEAVKLNGYKLLLRKKFC